jgi:chromosome segregation ATPase
MKKFLVVVLVLLVGVAALGYWQGWFKAKEGEVGVAVDAGKFKKDKAAFSKTVGEKAKALKGSVADLWKKAKGLTGDEKAHLEKELAELEKKHERLEKQLEALAETDEDKFESVKKDLSKDLEVVEKKIEELTKKLDKQKDK